MKTSKPSFMRLCPVPIYPDAESESEQRAGEFVEISFAAKDSKTK
jgi:hypothetical protein